VKSAAASPFFRMVIDLGFDIFFFPAASVPMISFQV